eukprot:NODE_291_length_1525_cov_211.417344_g211_i0.p1 GENE.NODE_291_length_1525_cov_211.417344_g211_i0~~NODE_291_length_1525_cov_211.417344_g211_i0.p1  ORF type:complete len:194 (-),score=70.67 NODE_291_length_1525_cov_211.417344_g211_i0:370-951(-)
MQLPMMSTLKLLTESPGVCCRWDVGCYVFQGARVFDGQYGRFNLVVVNFWAYCGRILMFQLLLLAGTGESTSRLLFTLAMMPLLFGDTFGEICGSLYGRLRFPVYGLGEVNSKSVEGTLAVLVSSLAAQIGTFYVLFDMGRESDGFFHTHPVLVFGYTCFFAAIVEAAAPRSTDNFFLQVQTLLLLLLARRAR